MELSIEDRFAIEDLYTRYCYAIDSLDVPEWVSCFTEDGTFAPAYGTIGGEHKGREALAAFAADPARDRGTRHWNTNLRFVSVAAGEVQATCYALLVDYEREEPFLRTHVVYHDTIRRVDGRWLFASRRPRRDAARTAPTL
ncbi:nuclear transport factor 2 family protein [Dactylosporangium sp. NPDC051485]|uniref:nuclear transport factor 2 family protein n=1 Tax=Dactylosporangium sp. NPDC051485 TaxID=3154846 RepID=UPI00343912A7